MASSHQFIHFLNKELPKFKDEDITLTIKIDYFSKAGLIKNHD